MDEQGELRYMEIRAASDSREISGIVVPYNSRANIGGLFDEIVEPGVFKGNLDKDIFLNRQHDRKITLARLGRNLELEDTPQRR